MELTIELTLESAIELDIVDMIVRVLEDHDWNDSFGVVHEYEVSYFTDETEAYISKVVRYENDEDYDVDEPYLWVDRSNVGAVLKQLKDYQFQQQDTDLGVILSD